MSKYFNRGHYGLQSATEKLSKEWSASDLKQQASLYLDFANGEYFTRSLSDSGTPKQFGDILTFTRDSDKAGFAPNGLATVGADTPALPLDPATGERLGLSIHGQATNRFINSENIFGAGWVRTNAVESTTHFTTGVDGQQVAAIEVQTSGSRITLGQVISPKGSNGVSTAYIKKGSGIDGVSFISHDAGTSGTLPLEPYEYKELYAPAIDATFSLTPTFDGWYRIKVVVNAALDPESSGLFDFRFRKVSGDENLQSGDYVFFQKPQQVLGVIDQPYIATPQGSTVTRLADNCRITDLDQQDWWNPNEGTFVVEWVEQSPLSSNRTVVAVGDNDFGLTSYFGIQARSTNLPSLGFAFVARLNDESGVVQNAFSTFSIGKQKAAFSIKNGTLTGSINGNQVVTIGNVRREDNQIIFGAISTLREDRIQGSVSSFSYEPRAYSAAELQQASQL